MTISMCVLGSGSRGNCTLLVLNGNAEARYVLVDCGLSPKQTRTRLAPLGVTIEQISAILVTHVDGDHYNPGWRRPIAENTTVVA